MFRYMKVLAIAKAMGVTVAFKDESKFMKFLGFLLFFNKKFMATYSTTIGSTVYFPSREWLKKNTGSAAVVMAHELQHVKDSKDWGMLTFVLMYLSPQIWSLLSLLAFSAIFLGPGALCFLSFLLYLLPFHSSGRSLIERRGYAITLACRYWLGDKTDVPSDFFVEKFTGMSYYKMGPGEKEIRAMLEEAIDLIKNDEEKFFRQLPLAKELKPIFAS